MNSVVMDENEFVETVKSHVKIADEALLRKAYNFAKNAHRDQKRDSGEPYFIHPLDIAIMTSEFKLDESSIIAALLHDVVEDTEITLEDIKREFGAEVAYLVDGLTKIDGAKFNSRTEKNAENFRKLILSTAKDIRVLMIKLLDRLNNMRTIGGIANEDRRKRITDETLMIYVPLAERIGMYKLKLELEDLCFKELFPAEREEILKNIKKATKNQKTIIDDIIKKLSLQIKFDGNIGCRIMGREKRPYSVWKKMQKKSVSFEKLFDIIAFRIIVKDLQDCYRVLGIINSNYVMIPDTFKDYISMPKPNGYQSLHIVIMGPKYIKMEVQIRTEEMDRVAEYGAASHWMYKQNIKNIENLKQYNAIKNIVENIEHDGYDVESYESLKYQIHEDEVFCYTPMGDIIVLPVGSTGIDFAYAIHRDVGNRCSGVKINGLLSQYKTPLNNGDEVEILTSKTPQVNEDWLNFVKTTKAKAEIKSFIRNSRQQEFERIGREIVDNIAKELKLSINDELINKNIGKFNGYKTAAEIYASIANGKIKTKDFIKILFPTLDKTKDKLIENKENLKLKIVNRSKQSSGIEGLDRNVAYKYAKCCYPIPPDDIVGVVNTGTGITIHKKDCKTLKNIEGEKIIHLEWNNDADAKYIAKLTLTMDGVPGILANVINLCSQKKINIIAITTLNESSSSQEMELKVEISGNDELENLKAALRGVKGVLDVEV